VGFPASATPLPRVVRYRRPRFSSEGIFCDNKD
jgi:hypothetical protein